MYNIVANDGPNPDLPTLFPEVLRETLEGYADKKAFLVWFAQPLESGGIQKMPCDPKDGAVRAPNSAKDRGVLTLAEALEAAERLRAEGMPVGVGLFAPNAGLTALDFDDVIEGGSLAKWVKQMIAGTYAEVSPSGGGVRVLYSSISAALTKWSNGSERGGLGVYGALTNKFVTLTGDQIDKGAISPMTEVQESAYLDRLWEMMQRDKPRDTSSGSHYPPGQKGAEEALDDILSGASLHPAMVHYATVMAAFMPLDEIEDVLDQAYHDSEAKTKTPARWHDRADSVVSIMFWLRRRGKDLRRLHAMPTQRLQAAKALVDRIAREKSPAAVEPAPLAATGELDDTYSLTYSHDELWAAIDDGMAWTDLESERDCVRTYGFVYYGKFDTLDPHVQMAKMIKALEYESLIEMYPDEAITRTADGSERDQDDIDEMRAVNFDRLGLYDIVMEQFGHTDVGKVVLAEMAEVEANLEQELMRERLEELRNPEPEELEPLPYWMIEDMPSVLAKDMAEHVLACQRYDMPALAALSSLVSLGVLSQNAFIVTGGPFVVPLNLFGIGVAPSGAGKEAGRQMVRLAGIMAGGTQVVGKVASASGLYDELLGDPARCKTLLWDEVWDLFSAISKGGGANSHALEMVAVLMESFSQGIGSIQTTSRARPRGQQTRPTDIYAPFVQLMGTTTPQRFEATLSDEFFQNGMIARTLIVNSRRGDQKPLGYQSPVTAPESLQEAMQRLAEGTRLPMQHFAGSKAWWAERKVVMPAARRPFFKIEMSGVEALAIEVWARDLQAKTSDADKLQPVISRALEHALRIAGLMAVARAADVAVLMDEDFAEMIGRDGIRVSAVDVDYATRVVGHLLDDLRARAGEYGELPTSASTAKAYAIKDAIMEALQDPEDPNRVPEYKNKRAVWIEHLNHGEIPVALVTRIATGKRASVRERDDAIAMLQYGGTIGNEGDLPRRSSGGTGTKPRGWLYLGDE